MNNKSKESVLMLNSFTTSGKLLFSLKSGQGKEKELRQLCYN